MELAVEQNAPLPFRVAMHTGGMLVGGCIAPWWLMPDVTLATLDMQVDAALSRIKDSAERRATKDQHMAPVSEAFATTRQREADHQDEVTLYDATVLSAVGNGGGFRLPVVRIPLSAVTA